MQVYSNFNDKDLLMELNRGSERAFDEIYQRYWKSCYQSAYKVVKDEDTCMDILQDVFTWLWENRSTVRAESLNAYLRTAVKFKMLNFIRNSQKRDQVFGVYQNTCITELSADIILEAKQLNEMINEFIQQLPKQAGKIFYLSRYEQLSHREIAQQLQLSEKTVKKQINLVLKKLRVATKGAFFSLFFL